MPTIVFVKPDGSEISLSAPSGISLMRFAVQNGIEEIVGECGGAAACATCHVFVDPHPALPPVERDEDSMLSATAVARTERSRLACQILISDDLDEIKVELPESQI